MSSFKKLIKISITLLCLLMILLALLPWILSSLKPQTSSRIISKFLRAHVKVDKLQMSWFGNQHIENIHYEQVPYLIDVVSLSTDASLVDILLFSNMGKLSIRAPKLRYQEIKAVTQAPLLQSSTLPDLKLSAFLPKLPKGTLSLTRGEVLVDQVSFSQIEASASIANKNSINLDFSGMLVNADKKGEVIAHCHFADKSLLDIELKQIPLMAVDTLATAFDIELPFSLNALFGSSLDATIKGNLSPDSISLDLIASSDNGSLETTLMSKEDTVYLSAPLKLKAHISPAIAQLLLEKASLETSSECLIDVLVDQGSLQGEDLQFSGNYQISAAVLSYQQKSLKDTSLQGSFSFQKEALELISNGVSHYEEKPFNLSLKVEGLNPSNNSLNTLNCSLQQFPLNFIGSDVLGTTLDVSATFEMHEGENQATINATTDKLHIDPLNLKGSKMLVLQAPAKITYQEEPYQLQATLKTLNLDLDNPANSQVEVEALLNPQMIDGINVSITEIKVQIDTLENITLQLKNELLELKSAITLNLDKELIKVKETSCHFNLSPEQGNPLFKEWSLSLEETLNADLILEPFSFSWTDESLPNLKSSLQFAPFSLNSASETFAIDQMKMQGKLEISKQNATYHIDGGIAAKTKELPLSTFAPFTLDFAVQNWQSSKGSFSYDLKIARFPSHFLGMLLKKEAEISALLDDSFDLRLKMASVEKKDDLFLQLSSPNLTASAEFLIQDGFLTLLNPSKLSFTLTPKGYAVLDRLILPNDKSGETLTLKGSSQIDVSLDTLKLPVLRSNASLLQRSIKPSFDLKDLICSFTMKIPSLAFYEKKLSREILLDNFECHVNNREKLECSLVTDVLAFNAKLSKEGSLKALFSLTPTFDAGGKFLLDSSLFSLNMMIDSVPSSALDLFAKYAKIPPTTFQDLFGPTIHANIQTSIQNLSGPVNLNISSKDTRLFIDGKLQNGVLLLNAPLTASISMTKDMSRVFLSEINPLGIQYMESNAPISFTIDPSSFTLPLFPYLPEKVNISSAKLELGKVICDSDGTLNETLSMLKYQKDSNKVSLWFTPINFFITAGLLNLSRADILVADAYQLAIWGEANLVNRQLDMILGLTAEALSQAFGLRNLPPDYVMRIPIRGSFDDVKIDSKQATSKIATILALEHGGALAEQFGGSTGAIIGGFMKKMQVLPDLEKAAPAPQNPLPWGSDKPEQEEKQKNQPKRRRAIKSSDRPLKQLKKILF